MAPHMSVPVAVQCCGSVWEMSAASQHSPCAANVLPLGFVHLAFCEPDVCADVHFGVAPPPGHIAAVGDCWYLTEHAAGTHSPDLPLVSLHVLT